MSHLKVMQWYLVRGELGREESDADDDEEKAVEARAHDEERRPAKREEELSVVCQYFTLKCA